MSVSIVSGTNSKPASSGELKSLMADFGDSGNLFIGFPIISTPDGSHTIDALLVSPTRGLVVFDLVEGTSLADYQARQDDSANKLEARLKTHRRLMDRRRLRVPIHTLSFAPGVTDAGHEGNGNYPVTDRTTLHGALDDFTWDASDRATYQAALSAIENISAIRKNRTPRTVHRPDSRGAKLKKLEESISTLDPKQGRAVIQTVEGVQRIRGLAGSGKTIVLALKAAYLQAQHPEWRIAVTFNTRSLKGHFRRLINSFSHERGAGEPDWRRLRVVNAWGAPGSSDRDGLYCEFCRAYGLEYLDFSSARRKFGRQKEFEGACRQALDEFKNSGHRRPLYDAILVDEAQDLPDSFLRICYELLAEPRRLVYAYDELQNLIGEPVSSPEQMFGLREDGTPHVQLKNADDDDAADLILERCYRNSRPVLTTAHALGFGIYRKPDAQSDTGLVQMFESAQLWREIGYRVQDGRLQDGSQVVLGRTDETSPLFLENHSNPDDLVQFICFKDKAEQYDRVVEGIKRDLQGEELRHDDIVVINPDPLTTRNEVGIIRSRLLELGINSHLAGVDTSADVFFQEDTDSITFTGIHRAKGNEAGMVYIINAQDCHTAGRNLASLRNRLFVAITRSKAWVRVFGIGSRMAEIQAEYDQLRAHDYSLALTYPTPQQRRQLRIVHRDMTAGERRRLRESDENLGNLVSDLESGRIHLEDLDEMVVDKLKDLLGGGTD